MRVWILMLSFIFPWNLFAEDLTLEDFSLPILGEEKKFDLKSFEYDFIVLDFWASWCGPCQTSLPFFKEQYEMWKKKRVLFIGVNLDAEKQEALDFLKKQDLNYPVLTDTGRKLSNKLDVSGIPRTFIFDKQLHIMKSLKGYTLEKREELRWEFKQIFSQGGKK